MTQVHKRFTDDQLRSLFRAYEDGQGEEVGGPWGGAWRGALGKSR